MGRKSSQGKHWIVALLASPLLAACGGAAPHQYSATDFIPPVNSTSLPSGGCTLPAGYQLPPGYQLPAGTQLPTGCDPSGGVPTGLPTGPISVPLPPVATQGLAKIYGLDAYAAYLVDYFGVFSSGFNATSRNDRILKMKDAYNNNQTRCQTMPYWAWTNNTLRAQAYSDDSQASAKKWFGVMYKILLQRDMTDQEAQYWAAYGQQYAEDNAGLFDDPLPYAVQGIEQGILSMGEWKAMCVKTGLKF